VYVYITKMLLFVEKLLCMLGGKGTVQFYQDDVEHTVSLQDIRPQKVH